MICSKCGRRCDSNSRYCTFCGALVEPVRDAPETKAGLPGYVKIIVAACIILTVAAISLFTATLYFSGSNQDDSTDKTQSSEIQDTQNNENNDSSVNSAATQSNHRYEVFNDSLTWKEAKIACEKQGGHLATITTEDEYYKIVDLIERDGIEKYHYWLGATDEESEGNWKWITGEKVLDGYSHWDSGKPNNSGITDAEHGEDYMELNTTQIKKRPENYMSWNDVCNTGVAFGNEGAPDYFSQEYYGYICEWDD